MKIKNLTALALSLILFLSLVSLPRLTAKEKMQEAQEKEIRTVIPETVKATIQEGMQTRQPRLDLPFTIIKCYYFPAQRNIHVIVKFECLSALFFRLPPRYHRFGGKHFLLVGFTPALDIKAAHGNICKAS